MGVAVIFPGQGSQYPGMGRDLYRTYAVARETFDRADEVLGFKLSELCFKGTAEELRRTENAQAAILVHSLACWSVLAAAGFTPDAVAGHSVGEYAALVAAGALGLEDALRLVRLRGQLMAGVKTQGAMVAVMGLAPATAEKVARESGADVAAINSPQQQVLSGEVAAVVQAAVLARQAGALRCTFLEVSQGFHSWLMAEIQKPFQRFMEPVPVRAAGIPVIGNVTGRPCCEPAEIRLELVEQLVAPVRWLDGVGFMIDMGCDTFFEVGPGKTLTGLNRNIQKGMDSWPAGDAGGLARILKLIQHQTPAAGERRAL